MNLYYLNKKPIFTEPELGLMELNSFLSHVNDPIFEMKAVFTVESITISGKFENAIAVDAFCIGNTNAYKYKLETAEGIFEGYIKTRQDEIEGYTRGLITIHDLDDVIFIDSFKLTLDGEESLFLGHLFFGQKVVLPRFKVEPQRGTAFFNEASRSFGGQSYGMKRTTLDSFAVKYQRITYDERQIITEYMEKVQNTVPHIIDPYSEARDFFPPMYVTLNIGESQMTKLNEDGFFYSGSLAWKEAK